MMRGIYNNLRIILISILAIQVGCTGFLDEDPRSLVLSDTYYQTPFQAEAGVVGVYNALQRSGVYGQYQYFLVTDIIRMATWNTEGGLGTYAFSSQSTDVIASIWADHFRGVNEANAVIGRLENVEMDEDRKKTLIAEARFLRALYYFNLIRYFGDVPYRLTETRSADNLSIARTSTVVIYEGIIDDLEFGIENLDEKGHAEPGRATVGAAKTLLAKVYLTRASMNKRDGKGDGAADYGKAADMAWQVIESGQYQLNPYFPDAFIAENKNNDEIIFDVQFKSGGVGEGNYIGMHMGLQGSIPDGGSWGNIHATEYFHTIYEEGDSVRSAWTTPYITVDGPDSLRVAGPWKIGKFRRFPVRNGNYLFSDFNINWPVFRYAEVLLIFAEAQLEFSNGPTSEIYWALNQLRARARNFNGDGTIDYLHKDVLPRSLGYNPLLLPDLTPLEYSDYASLKEYIRMERARELGGEGKRWFDLVRWGKLVENIRFLLDHVPEGSTRPEINWEIVAGNVQEHHQLLPIPAVEIQANPKMTQNPGY